MRHLINSYIRADPADNLGNLSSLTLTELIVETGIHDAIAKQINAKGKLSKNAISEGIINNVRKKIILEQLTNPRFYSEMSLLLDDLIKLKKEGTIEYEEFL
jgi:type I restriction enzyme R subunit